MGSLASESRLELLAAELEALGMQRDSAARVSTRLLLRHPLARRMGVLGLERWLRQRGMPAESAADGAAMLFALEGFACGRRFDQVIQDLRVAGADGPRAHGAALEAARIHRSARAEPPPPTPRLGHFVAWLSASLALLAFAAVLCSL